MAHEMTEKYKSWLVSLDSDNFTMYIKTWFAFLDSVHELILSSATAARRDELLAMKGDKVYLDEYRNLFLQKIQLSDGLRESIWKVYEGSREIVRSDYPEFYFVTYYKKIQENRGFYKQRRFAVPLCSCNVDVDIKRDSMFIGMRFGERPKLYREKFGPYLKLDIPLAKGASFDAVDYEGGFYDLVLKKIHEMFYVKGLMKLDSRKVRLVSQLILQVYSSIQSDKVYDLIYRPWIASEKNATAQEMREWFFDFCYSLRNVMFHRVIDPFDRRWSDVMKNCFQGLREFLLENIKSIEDVGKK